MNWAWHQGIKPVPKLILMVLADAADDQGICWPSVATIAVKVGVSTRTVRRVMQILISRELLSAEQRYRSDGSCSSNRYRLLLEGGDKLSPAPDRGDTTPGRTCQGPPDGSVIPGTTIGTIKEPPQPPKPETGQSNRSGGELFYLVYPKDLLPAERSQADVMIAALAAPLNQQVLDEWAGIIAAGAIRSSTLGCLRALVKRAQEGTFAPERALHIAQTRKLQQRVASAHTAVPDLAPVDENNALVRRLMAIGKRVTGDGR
ncbi:MAG: helix-turn-helix domain-containing protein [Gammaproteobacteria bacterium]|nr:MAG: helix-turn-helix domain-containing protein [Gammaproteobacteria bacterium]